MFYVFFKSGKFAQNVLCSQEAKGLSPCTVVFTLLLIMMCPSESQINNHMLPVSASDQYEALLEMAEESHAAKSSCHSLKMHIIIRSTRVCRLTLMFCHIYLQIQGCNHHRIFYRDIFPLIFRLFFTLVLVTLYNEVLFVNIVSYIS